MRGGPRPTLTAVCVCLRQTRAGRVTPNISGETEGCQQGFIDTIPHILGHCVCVCVCVPLCESFFAEWCWPAFLLYNNNIYLFITHLSEPVLQGALQADN